VDGTHLTTGFQPLIAFLEVPFFWVSSNPDVPLHAALVLLAVLDALTAVVLARIAYRFAGPVAAVVAAAAWALSPVAIGNALGGLEAALAILLEVTLVAAWLAARADRSGERAPWLRWAVVGVLAALAVLARVDALALVGLLVVAQLTSGRDRNGTAAWRAALPAAIAGAVVLAPWWIYSVAISGSPVPESGAAVRQLVKLHSFPPLDRLGWAAGTAVGPPFTLGKGWRHSLFSSGSVGALVFVGVLILLAGWAYLAIRRGSEGRILAALPVFAVVLLLFYSLYLGALWFSTRYLAPVGAVAALGVGLLAGWCWEQITARNRPRRAVARHGAIALSVGFAALLLIGFGVAVGLDVRYLTDEPPQTADVGLDGAKGYREVALSILAATPRGAVVGSFQSGALGYYAPADVQVLNLDGVVNTDAARALVARKVAGYARSQDMTYFADWPYNRSVFLTVAGDRTLNRRSFVEVTRAHRQGGDVFTLWRFTPRG
jgi:MFS family permease